MLLAPGWAAARDMTGKGGLGVLVPTSSRLGHTPVLALRYWRSAFAFEAAGGADWFMTSAGDDDTRRVFGQVGGTWRLVDSRRLTAGLGGRLWMVYESRELTLAGATGTEYEITNDFGLILEILLVAEYFFTDHFGISASVGPALSWGWSCETQSRSDCGLIDVFDARRGATVLELGGRYGGGIGMTYYF